MKLKTFIALITATFVITSCGISASASDSLSYDDEEEINCDYDPEPFHEFGCSGFIAVKDVYEYVEVYDRYFFVKQDTLLLSKQHLLIQPIGNTSARLKVTDGAVFKVRGDIFIERGGTLEIDDGTVVVEGGKITNCGTIKIGKNGTLKITGANYNSSVAGTLDSTASGEIVNEGSILCHSANINDYFGKINRYDSNFNLSDFSLYLEASKNTANVKMNYCIDDIMTNFGYKFTVGTDNKKITRFGYSSEVYSSETAKKLRERAAAFEKTHSKEHNFGNNSERYLENYGYRYNYKTDKLSYSAKWSAYDYNEEKFIEHTFSGNA